MKQTATLFICALILLTGSVQAVTPEQKSSVVQALKVNDWDTALNLAKKLVKESPRNSEAHYLLAGALRIKMQQVSKARALFSLGDYKSALAKSIELDSNNIDARSEEIGFYLFAPSIAGGDKAYAIERTQALKEIDPFSGLTMEALLAASEKNTEKQQQILKEMLRLKPNSAYALMQMAALKSQLKDYAEADKLLQEIDASEDKGWPMMAQYQRAKWRIINNQETAFAIELLNDYRAKLADIETEMYLPTEAAVIWRLALAYEKLDNIEKAKSLLKQSTQLDPNLIEAAEDLKRLSK